MNRPMERGILVQGSMNSRFIIIGRTPGKDAAQLCLERLGVITSQPLLGGLHHQYGRI